MNIKHKLMDFYLDLLALPQDHFRLRHQSLYATIRDVLATELECDAETVQIIFERMTKEGR